MKKRLAFIGAMGSGKSSLARRYTAEFGGTVFDTDREFVKRYGSISVFFARRGEAEFRRIETNLLIEAARSDCTVISTGGGAVYSEKGMAALRKNCDIVYLTAPIDVLKARIKNSDRPLKNDLERVLKERAPLYEKYADYTVDSSLDSLVSLKAALKNPRKNRYDIVLTDSDDTILDFTAACARVVSEALKSLGVKCDFDKAAEEFRILTDKYWRMHEKGEITRERLFAMREREFSERVGARFSEGEFNGEYRRFLRETKFVRFGATDFLASLKSRGVKVYIITNADSYCADERLKPVIGYTNGAFVSEEIGFSKPDSRFFDAVFDKLGCPDKNRVIVFGDGEGSDISGAVSYGLDCCLYAPNGYRSTAATYAVKDYDGFLELI